MPLIKQTTAFGAVLAAAPSITLGQGQRVFKFAWSGVGTLFRRGPGITAAATRLGHKAVMSRGRFFQRERRGMPGQRLRREIRVQRSGRY